MAARYTNPEHTSITVVIDGQNMTVPAEAGNRHYDALVASGVTIELYAGPAPTVDDVADERERRLALGFDYDFGDARGVHRIATTEADMKGWDEVTKWSSAAIALGNGSATIDVLTETGPCTVTALEWQSVLIAATAARQPLWAASFYLQTLDPIPSDYATNEAYWTA